MRQRATDAAPAIRAMRVRKSFGDTEVLKGVDFDAWDGEVTCLIGPSGSGKSTLLRCLNHIETIDSGEIWFKGKLVGYTRHKDCLYEASEREIARMRARMGMVFQNFNLFGHTTALENVTAGPIMVKRISRENAKRLALDHLDRVGLADKAHQYPQQLSGGQQQRVAIARALAMEPELLLLDEPTSALDPDLVEEVLVTIRELATSGATMIVVTHDLGLVRDIADRIAFMSDGQVVEHASADRILRDPSSELVRSFVDRAAGKVARPP
ncbi:MAG: amino acid ABC transporter ATP-binding protein [Acetobacteraceae bacterium]